MAKIMMTLFLAAASAMPAAAQEQLEGFTAKLFTAKGTVEYQKAGTTEWKAVKAPYMLEMGDQIKTGRKSKAEIYIKYGAKVRLGADTQFVLTKVSAEANAVDVLRGKMYAWVRKFKGRGFAVRTPTAVCAVRGTTFGVEVAPGGQSVWDLFDGLVEIADSRNNIVPMVPGQRLAVVPDAAAAPVPMAIPAGVSRPSEPAKTKEEKAEIKAEQIIIQQQAAAAAAAVVAPQPDPEPIQEVIVQEPETSVIPTATVQESQEVSASTPQEEPPVEEPPLDVF
ncbi:MAG: hypothetical protein CVU79_00275 [Elusimicrobia bacterium HGW-Elusimicrobia-3]|jgi:hypothetical protein|nr:MAG: hypothetical protein CVU79_00275 [Elusimicrobia bacterium HGW-Elusimicrobia-3]